MSKWPIKRDGIEDILFEIDGLKVDFSIDRFEPYKEWEDGKWCDIWFEIDDGMQKETIGGEEMCAYEVVYIRDFIKDVLDGKDPGPEYNTIEPYYAVRKSTKEPYAIEWEIPRRYPTDEYYYGNGKRILVFRKNDLERLYTYLDKVIRKEMEKYMSLPLVNRELMEAIKDKNFDEKAVRVILAEVSNVDTLLSDECGYPTTYMNEAVLEENYRMIKLLFEYGANPNFVWEDSYYYVCPFRELTIGGIIGGIKTKEDEEYIEYELTIARLFLEQGADADLTVKGDTIMGIAIDRSIDCKDDGYAEKFYRLLKEFHPGILWRVILPEREYDEIVSLDELVQLFSGMVVGHHIEKVFYESIWSSKRWEVLHDKYEIDDNNHDADRALGPRVLLLFDNGVFDLKFGNGKFGKRIFSLSEVSKDLLGLLEDDAILKTPVWDQYYETKGPLADTIASAPVEAVSKGGDELPEVSFQIGKSTTITLFTNSADEFYFIVKTE